jgi:hypothetical protein
MFTEQIKKTIKSAAKSLTGYKRREFVGQVAIDYYKGSSRNTEKHMGWDRKTVETGINEIRSGIRCIDNFSARGNIKIEVRMPNLEADIKKIVEPHSQADPDFKNTYTYLKITTKSVKQELIKLGYSTDELPTENTIGNILNRLNYSLKRVQKKTFKKDT